jgi:hypothetical protein
MFRANCQVDIFIYRAGFIFVCFVGKNAMFAVKRDKFGNFRFVGGKTAGWNYIIATRYVGN